MARYHATVRLFDLEGADPGAAARQLEERLEQADVGRFQVTQVRAAPPPLVVRRTDDISPLIRSRLTGPALLLGVAAYALWFYWLLLA